MRSADYRRAVTRVDPLAFAVVYLTINALAAADELLIPAAASAYSEDGLVRTSGPAATGCAPMPTAEK